MSEEGKTADGLDVDRATRYADLERRGWHWRRLSESELLALSLTRGPEAESTRMEVRGRRLTPRELVRVFLHPPFELSWIDDLRALFARLVPMAAR